MVSAYEKLNSLPMDYADVKEKLDFCKKYKNVSGYWKCTGYDTGQIGGNWITKESSLRKQDITVKVTNEKKIYVHIDGESYRATLDGNTLKWKQAFEHFFNCSTGKLYYIDHIGKKIYQAYER